MVESELDIGCPWMLPRDANEVRYSEVPRQIVLQGRCRLHHEGTETSATKNERFLLQIRNGLPERCPRQTELLREFWLRGKFSRRTELAFTNGLS
jgi:hypothetical protein